jgi:hypothetical protein
MKAGLSLWAIFCDDVRREEGNKLSYMGVYQSLLAVQSFPTVLPRLCIALNLRIDRDAIPSEIRFRLCRDDAVLAENVVPADAIAAAKVTTERISEDRYLSFGTIFQMFPVELPSQCFLRARAICDGEEIKGGSLAIIEHKDLDRFTGEMTGTALPMRPTTTEA